MNESRQDALGRVYIGVKPPLVRLVGIASDTGPGSGKDTFANQLVTEKTLVAPFAQALSNYVYGMFLDTPIGDLKEIRHDPQMKNWKFSMLSPGSIPSGYGFDEYKKFLSSRGYGARDKMSMRDHLVLYGNDFMKVEMQQPNFWIDEWRANIRARTLAVTRRYGQIDINIVVPDVRTPQEAQAIKDMGGILVNITADWLVNRVLDSVTATAEGALKGWKFDAHITNVLGGSENMKVQFDAKFRF